MRFKKIKLVKNQKLYMIYLIIVLCLLLLLFFFQKQIISIVFTIMLIAIGSLSSFFKRITGINLGIEFITFSTFLLVYSYGITFGIVACAIMIIISSLSVGRISPETFTGFIMYCFIAVMTLFFDYGIALNGIFLVLIMNILGFIIILLLGFDIARNSIYLLGNTVFNYILFRFFSEIIFTLL